MILTKLDDVGRNKLFVALSKLTSSLNKRGVSVLVVAQSDTLATINLIVVGKKGMGEKSFILLLDADGVWKLVGDGIQYTLLSIEDLNGVLKNRIIALSTILTKI